MGSCFSSCFLSKIVLKTGSTRTGSTRTGSARTISTGIRKSIPVSTSIYTPIPPNYTGLEV